MTDGSIKALVPLANFAKAESHTVSLAIFESANPQKRVFQKIAQTSASSPRMQAPSLAMSFSCVVAEEPGRLDMVVGADAR
jgi:hypothetical protein